MFVSTVSHLTTLRVVGVLSFFSFLLLTGPASAVVAGDVNNSGAVDAVDIQLVINAALGIGSAFDCDINKDGQVNAVDIQLVINAALGIVLPNAPTVSSFTVNGDTATTTSRTIRLNNACTDGPIEYTASELATFTGATWQAYGQAPLFPLSAGDGVKAVYFKTRNAYGESNTMSDTITLNESTGTEETLLLPGNAPLVMVWIPAGTFMMGRYLGEQDSYSIEDPRHQVTLSQGFWMGKYELTKRQWQAVMNTTPWSGLSYVLNDPDSPAVYVSWNDAQTFMTALNAYTGKSFRLPSEGQWEYACRAGTATRFYWGDDASYTQIGNYAWYFGNSSSEMYAHVVGLKLPNALGLYDMSGNVLEWCQDWWHDNYTGAPTDGSAWELPTSLTRVLRGGGWDSNAIASRSALRNGVNAPVYTDNFVGFRVVRTP